MTLLLLLKEPCRICVIDGILDCYLPLPSVRTHHWWHNYFMNNFVSQLPALIGVVVGVLGTILATTVTDKNRWNREQAVRWDERRLNAYADYAAAIKKIHVLALRLSANRMSVNLAQPISRDIGLPLLEEAESHRTSVWETVLLLGDEATVAAAREWRNKVGRLVDFACDPSEEDESLAWSPAVRHADEARDRFYEVARISIRIHGGSVAQAQLLPSAWVNSRDADG
jgi:hypothetical protein